MTFVASRVVLSGYALIVGLNLASCAADVVQEPLQDGGAEHHSGTATGSPAVFDWFANDSAATSTAYQARMLQAAEAMRLGRGSWICSPSGFGQRSSCVRR